MVNPIRALDAAKVPVRVGGDLAATVLSRARTGQGVDPAKLAHELNALPADQAPTVRQQVEAQLSPVDRGRLAEASVNGAVDLKSLSLDLGQMALDIVGIFEPTPFADLTNAGISLVRGDGLGAALSAAGALPYVGDAAKLGKLGHWAKTVSTAVEVSLHNSAARKALAPALGKLADALKAIPDSVLSKLPGDAGAKLKGLRSQVDTLANPIAREVRAATDAAASRLGVPPERLRAVADTEWGKRPPVSTYMSPAQQARHLSGFDEGVVRVTQRSNVAKWGTLGPSGGFTTSLRDFKAIMKEANGDLAVVERRLSLDPGTLKSNNTLIAVIKREDAPSLRVPTGNEDGVNKLWAPGGYTSQNTVEAVMDFPTGLPFREIKL